MLFLNKTTRFGISSLLLVGNSPAICGLRELVIVDQHELRFKASSHANWDHVLLKSPQSSAVSWSGLFRESLSDLARATPPRRQALTEVLLLFGLTARRAWQPTILSTGHEWDHVSLREHSARFGTYSPQNGTFKKGPQTKMSRTASRPVSPLEEKDSFNHGGGTSVRPASESGIERSFFQPIGPIDCVS